MSQVISRAQNQPDSSRQSDPANWRRPILIAFHGAAASTYGFAICWQNVSARLYLRTNPLMRCYGKWRFLTYNCLVMQFVAYSLCLASHFVPRLRRPRDFFFTTFALPVGLLVVTSFWAVWFSLGREFIFPVSIEPFYPSWLNHVTHTIIAPINLAELVLVRHDYSSERRSVIALSAYVVSYASFLLYIRVQTGRFVYPFLNTMEATPVGALILGMSLFTLVAFKGGQLLTNIVHGVKSVRGRIAGGGDHTKKAT